MLIGIETGMLISISPGNASVGALAIRPGNAAIVSLGWRVSYAVLIALTNCNSWATASFSVSNLSMKPPIWSTVSKLANTWGVKASKNASSEKFLTLLWKKLAKFYVSSGKTSIGKLKTAPKACIASLISCDGLQLIALIFSRTPSSFYACTQSYSSWSSRLNGCSGIVSNGSVLKGLIASYTLRGVVTWVKLFYLDIFLTLGDSSTN